ncbi:MAG: hypothetical protein R3C14_16075 [Caldilineaceae bacterium]
MSDETQFQIILPNTFTQDHERALTIYLSNDGRLDTAGRQKLYEAIQLLSQAEVKSGAVASTFRQVYDDYIDEPLADTYFTRLLALADVPTQSPALTAEFARQIAPVLTQARLLSRENPQSYLLFAYCVYWWQSFARGYAFEVEIQQDLEQSQIDFTMHDLLQRDERYSQADLIVLDLLGDIKTSTYFLQLQPSGPLINDFYITRLYHRERVQTLVVFQKSHAWQRIGGKQTAPGNLDNVLDLLPQPVQLVQSELTLIVVEYEHWKEMVRRVQAAERN